ncbi:UDP-N-acetylmuramoyl-L-alanyl-D-glutamate--2,6-diaminopimelate ligase [Chengkuizengella axinellae]|uniref:UDP-N-acetylmuramyl-tripeptide synthetase n=1 Tax=Chengkuizengella axinellae TaxID=3064388 RepID=A0ABT9J0C8_9BACL|nr:UDP-N-acetylmuramoyl-L-alanyl-D-glutamate--2,6-diaminopimelate ligase [Chengkuizengella sp. 2205SS18-9]MDP5275063.1 UDP-N-acetylmuramoyl-L-alanyl-D-glutamate--2,6-diaminopimelate ligase [Chengkuizengella sp. 2205SS18-9]
MLLSSVLQDLKYDKIKGDTNIEISAIAYDSRKVVKNGLFLAISGFAVDGHTFIDKAIDKGATVIIVEEDVKIEEDITVLKVTNSRNALARISSNYYHRPTEKLNVVGITGTNGKTSISYFLKSIFEHAERSIGLIGTIGTVINNKVEKNLNTTPESLNLQHTFSKMIEARTDHCIMEVSSHALNLDRVAYSHFNTAIFTNLSPDHLELHHDMEEYFEAKAKLFELSKDYNIINIDDDYGKKLINKVEKYETKLLTYGLDKDADIFASNIKYSADGTTYKVHTPSGNMDMKVNLPGVIYVYNSLAAIACAYCNQIPLEVTKEGIQKLEGIKGRFEVVYQKNNYKIVIDFAHTEDALKNAILTLKQHAKGRIIVVFGVYADPGESGTDKRRAMGQVAANYADFSIVTSDNPKDQDPDLIIQEITQAIEESGGTDTYDAVVDRKEAIKYAIDISEQDDIILIAGKGHETSQVIGTTEIPFNEKEIVLDIIKNKNQVLEI